MSYGTIATELAHALGKQIIAYDNLPDHGGCILHLAGPLRRIDISIEALNEWPDDLAGFVRQTIASSDGAAPCLRVGVRDGSLAIV